MHSPFPRLFIVVPLINPRIIGSVFHFQTSQVLADISVSQCSFFQPPIFDPFFYVYLLQVDFVRIWFLFTLITSPCLSISSRPIFFFRHSIHHPPISSNVSSLYTRIFRFALRNNIYFIAQLLLVGNPLVTLNVQLFSFYFIPNSFFPLYFMILVLIKSLWIFTQTKRPIHSILFTLLLHHHRLLSLSYSPCLWISPHSRYRTSDLREMDGVV